MTKLKGLRCDIITKEEIKYIFFYDIDKPITQIELDWIDDKLQSYKVSYMVIKTKHGHHVIGMTPLDVLDWSLLQSAFKAKFNSYYGGIIIRLSLKKDEQQVLLVRNTEYGEVIPNLSNIFANRFNYKKLFWQRATAKYLLVFEVYRSEKE